VGEKSIEKEKLHFVASPVLENISVVEVVEYIK